MVRLTASGTPRAFQCVASLVLPRKRYESAYADAGSANHEEIEAAIDVGDESAIPDAVLALIQPGDVTVTEKAFAYDVATDTARVLPSGKHKRDYSMLRPFEVPGTPDLIIKHATGRVTVVDHKKFAEVDAADQNEQAATYALMIARAWGLDEIDVMIHYVEATWRSPTYATLGALDFDAHAARLKQLQLDAVKAQENPLAWVKKGNHCSYCECWADCPAWEGLRGQVKSGELALAIETQVSDEDGAALWALRDQLKIMLSRVTAVCYARAKERPIPLPDGNVLAFVEKEGKRKIDGDAAYRAIRERYGSEIADASVRRSVAQKWIEDALKQAGVPKAGAAVKAIVKQLEESGAVTRDTKEVCEVVPAVKLLKEVG